MAEPDWNGLRAEIREETERIKAGIKGKRRFIPGVITPLSPETKREIRKEVHSGESKKRYDTEYFYQQIVRGDDEYAKGVRALKSGDKEKGVSYLSQAVSTYINVVAIPGGYQHTDIHGMDKSVYKAIKAIAKNDVMKAEKLLKEWDAKKAQYESSK